MNTTITIARFGSKWKLPKKHWRLYTEGHTILADIVGRDLWEGLGLPDEDGEYRLSVSVEETP